MDIKQQKNVSIWKEMNKINSMKKSLLINDSMLRESNLRLKKLEESYKKDKLEKDLNKKGFKLHEDLGSISLERTSYINPIKVKQGKLIKLKE